MRDGGSTAAETCCGPAWKLAVRALPGIVRRNIAAMDAGRMTVSTYATLINQRVLVPSSRSDYVAVERNHLVDFLAPMLRQIKFDADFYLQIYPDIAEAIRDGQVESAEAHFLRSGYFEHRMPYAISVEEDWYLAQYEDVREAVAAGKIGSARQHYYEVGYREGRLPYAGFTMEEAKAH